MSNKTPKNNIDATESVPKKPRTHAFRKSTLILVVVVAFLVSSILIFFVGGHKKLHDDQPCLRSSTIVDHKRDNCLVSLEIAQDEASVEKGLGGRTSMPLSHGMLFIFEDEATHCFWMKDMNFHLDIVWFNANKEIVRIESDLSPETYPKTYCPDTPSKYVLEVNTGEAQNLQLKEGQKLEF